MQQPPGPKVEDIWKMIGRLYMETGLALDGLTLENERLRNELAEARKPIEE